MTTLVLASALFFVRNELHVIDINILNDSMMIRTDRLRKYSIQKLAQNYTNIIHGENPKYYPELY